MHISMYICVHAIVKRQASEGTHLPVHLAGRGVLQEDEVQAELILLGRAVFNEGGGMWMRQYGEDLIRWVVDKQGGRACSCLQRAPV